MALALEDDAVPACLDRVHELLDALWREAPGVDGVRRARFGIAVAELVGNVVEHGGRAREAAPRLSLRLWAGPAGLRAELCDDGAPVPEPGPPSGEVPEDAEAGRGIGLVHDAADEVRYERTGGANRWVLVVR